jgi:GH24 family phage-related lysozyme (muramidase)
MKMFTRIIFLLAVMMSNKTDAALTRLPDTPTLSPAGYQLILDYEVGGGQSYYDRFLSRPTWPGVQSGVTVGVGYDLGYNAAEVIRDDWRGLGATVSGRLAQCAGLTGQRAKTQTVTVSDVRIGWPAAKDVFDRTTLARFTALTAKTFPNFDALPADSQAALVSLVFNRGSSMYGDSRREMRAIRDLCAAARTSADIRAIAAQIRAMKRLWPTVRGLQLRRDAEADLVEASY